MRRSEHVILLKEYRGADDPYLTRLECAGFKRERIHCQPVLTSQVRGLEELSLLLETKEFSGLICTSQRAVKAWSLILRAGMSGNKTTWSQKPHFVVGPSTADALLAIDSAHIPEPHNVSGQHTGHADALARLIEAQHQHQHGHPLLYLTGDKRRDTLPTLLSEAGIPFVESCIYETSTDPAFSSTFSTHLDTLRQSDANIWIALFSPSGANAAVLALRAHTDFTDLWPRIRFATLGPTTASHLQNQLKVPPHAVAAHPTPEELSQAVAKVLSDQG